MTTSQTRLARTFLGLWDTADQNVTAKIILELTPHRQYTRADCPRYGDLAGPSCASGPPGDATIIGPNAAPASSPTLIGGNVGEVGSPQEQQRIASILGGVPGAAADILFGPLLRGNNAEVRPGPADQAPAGGPR